MPEYARTNYNLNNRIILNDDTTNVDRFVLVDPVALIDTIAQNTEEPLPTEPGIIDYGVKFGKGVAVIPVELIAATEADMAQLIQNVKEAFNPDLLEADATYGEATKYQGYHPFDWTETVGSNSRNFRIWIKSQETPAVEQDSLSGLVRTARLKLKARDPRKYLQGQSSLVGAGGAVNAGTYNAPVEITIAATGATSVNLQLINASYSPAKAIYVTTALANNDSLVIDTLLHSVKLNGTERRGLLGSGTEWWTLIPGQNTITFNNGALMTQTLRWYSSWPL